MDIVQYVVFAACWVVVLIYWTIGARSVKPTREKRSMGGVWRAVAAISVVFLFFESFGLPVRIYPLSLSLLPSSGIIKTAGAILTVAGFIVALLARRKLAGNWSASDKAVFTEGHELITAGPYRYVRHPIYSGFLLMFLGTVFFAGTVSAVISLLFVLLGLWFSLRREEEFLTEHFPEQYPEYKKRVKALIPFIC